MRGMEFYKGRLIAYSLGNFCGFGVLSSSGFLGVGGVLKVALRKDGSWASGRLVATEMVRGGLAAPDPDNARSRLSTGCSRRTTPRHGPPPTRLAISHRHDRRRTAAVMIARILTCGPRRRLEPER